jgi:hypothetical protein
MILEVDDDNADKITSRNLIQSYIWLKADLKRAKKNPNLFHEDDIKSWETLVPALEEVGKYFTYDWENEVKKVKKQL